MLLPNVDAPDSAIARRAVTESTRLRTVATRTIRVNAFTSSVSNTTSPLRPLETTGTICSLNQPAALALAARRWLSTARPSWSARVMPHLVAMFSAVTPMWMAWKGSCSAPTIMSTSLVSPMRAPQRAFSEA